MASKLKNLLVNILIFILLIIPSLGVSYYSYNQLGDRLTKEVHAERQLLAKQMAKIVESRLDAVRDVAITSAGDISDLIEQDNWEGAVQEIQHVSSEFPYVDRIFLSDIRGYTLAYYPPSPENTGKDFSFRDWYKGVSTHWQPYASEVFKRAPIPQFKTVAMMAPIKNSQGIPLGAVGFAINLDSFSALSQEFKVDKGGFLYIVNQKGQIVSHPKYDPQGEIVDYSSVPAVQELLKGQSGVHVAYNPIEKDTRLAAFEPVPEYHWGVVITDPVSTAFVLRDQTLNEFRNTFAIVVGLNALLALIVIYILNQLRRSREILQKNKELIEREKIQDEAILESTAEGVVGLDADGNCMLVNQAATRMLGYTKEELMGKNLHNMIHYQREDGTSYPVSDCPVYQSIISGKGIRIRNEVYIRKDKTMLPVSYSSYPLIISGKHMGVVVAFSDITKEREIDQMKTDFISLASHELRTPMTAIRGFVSMIMDGDYGEINPQLKEPLTDIQSSTVRLINLVNDMLNVSRIEQGRLKFDLNEFSVPHVIEELVRLLSPIAKNKGISLNYQATAIHPVQGDVDKFKEVLNNLVGNALKFTDKGSVLISTVEKDGMVTVFVSDTGMGISPTDQQKLFGKFQQLQDDRQGKPAGSGLGLYISKGLANKMGGDVWIEQSMTGRGSVFAISLPVVNSPIAQKIRAQVEKEKSAHPDQKSFSS